MDPAIVWRLCAFLGSLVLLSWAESRWPARVAPARRPRVRAVNFMLGILGALSTRLVVALGGVLAAQALQSDWPGLLGLLGGAATQTPLAAILGVVLGLLALDAALYLQHRLFHAVSWLWRWHAVHHSDAHLDASTALRFHPVELAISWLWKLAVVVSLGVPAQTLLIFEIALSSLALFNHANLHFGDRWERRLSSWLITPATHRRHHWEDAARQAPNFGFSVPWWDRLAGTWLPALGRTHDREPLGLVDWRTGAASGLGSLLKGKGINTR